MKNSIYSFFSVSCICLFVLATGCKPFSGTVDNAIRFDSLQVSETYHLFNDTTKPSCHVEICFVYPDSSNEDKLNALQSLFVETIFGESFKELSPGQVAKEYAKQYINGFKQIENQPVDTAVAEGESRYEHETGYTYYRILRDSILYNQNGFVSFFVEVTDYEGGARCLKSVYGYVVNLSTGALLQEDHFSGTNYRQNISCILADKIAEANGSKVEELENLGFNSLCDIAPNRNFTIDNKGITYYFNENEIAGFKEGIIRVFIPYNELKVYLTKDSPIASLIKL